MKSLDCALCYCSSHALSVCANYTGLSGSLPDTAAISRSPGTGHHFSRIKSSFELFCALV